MKSLNLLTLVLLIVGGVNWGLVGAFQFDLVAALFGGKDAMLARVVYVLVGLSALWQVVALTRSVPQGAALRRASDHPQVRRRQMHQRIWRRCVRVPNRWKHATPPALNASRQPRPARRLKYALPTPHPFPACPLPSAPKPCSTSVTGRTTTSASPPPATTACASRTASS